jgi:uncharacterized protein YkwD
MKKLPHILSIVLISAVLMGIIPCTSIYVLAAGENFDIQNGALVKYNGTDSTVIIPDGVTRISSYAFTDTDVVEVIIPNSVTVIEQSAFLSSRKLRKVNIPYSVSTIGDGALGLCDQLLELEIDKDNKHYTVVDGILYTKDMTELICCPSSKRGSISIPESVITIRGMAFWYCWYVDKINLNSKLENIEWGAFNGCHGLENIYIPAGVKIIEDRVFTDCVNLKNISVDKSNGYYVDIDGVLYTKDKKVLVGFPYDKTSSYIVHDGTEQIYNSVFMFNRKITLVTIPNSVKLIGPGCNTFWMADNVTIQCVPGSYAESYAKENNIPFKNITPVATARVPSAPSIGIAMVGDRQATVTFRASYDGGSPTTSYTVTSNPDNISATGASSPIVVKGLRNDVEYTFTVKANNSVGTSAPSLPSNIIVPMAIAEKDTQIDINTTTSFILNKDIVGAEGRKYDVPAYWNDKFFSNKSTSYNHDLAKISMQLSASAYSRSKGTGFGFINMDLGKLGFNPERIISYNYNVDDANTVGFTLALKSINLDGIPYNILVIGIRGTPGNIEWDGNFDIGINTTVHRGFQAATSDLLNKLEKYVKKYVNQSITTKVLIFGHSRGAAVANLVAKNLSAGFKVNHLLLASKNDIYAYTFAAPNVASDARQTEELYGNIFNFVHYDDFVPILPLDKWNYGRYGITLKFPRVNTAIAKMNSEFRKITGKKFMGYNDPYAVREFEENLGNIAPSVHAFYTDYKEVYPWYRTSPLTGTSWDYTAPCSYFEYVSQILQGKGDVISFGANASPFGTHGYNKITRFFIGNGTEFSLPVSVLLNPLYSGAGTVNIPVTKPLMHYSHAPETYISWLNALSDNWIHTYSASQANASFVKKITVACPVDVYIFDEDGEIVGCVVNNTIDETIGNPVNITLSGINSDIKNIILPAHGNFAIRFEGTDSGIMSYTISETDGEGMVIREITYDGIPLNKGIQYSGKISGEAGGAASSYNLIAGEDTVIPYSKLTENYNLNSSSAWAYNGIVSAIQKGFVPVDLQGSYQNVITREEFCRMAVKWVEYALGKNIDTILAERNLSRNPNAFSDTKDPDILAAFALGITSGTGDNKFTPRGQFNRQQAATMIMNTCSVIGADIGNPPDSGFADLNTVSDWAVNGINYVRANGVMAGTGGNNFSPLASYTREQSIVTFNNIVPELLSKVTSVLTTEMPDAYAFEREVFDLVNLERENIGLKPLEWHNQLAEVARMHSADMAQRGFFDHTSPDGLNPLDRIQNAGIACGFVAENIAQGQRTPREVVDSWMDSPGHKANILNENITHIGVGFYDYYWTQNFIY